MVRWRVMGGPWKEEEARTVKEIMERNGLSEEEYVPTIGGKVVTPDTEVGDQDEVTFIPVVSGG
jgi:sulfur carrier protein ThiS